MHPRRPPAALRRAVFGALLVTALAAQAGPPPGPEIGVILERLQGDRRVVLAYLAHDNPDLALTALDRWRATLRAEGARLAAARQGRSDPGPVLEALDASLAEAAQAVERADLARARALVEAATAPLDAWRRAEGLRLFSDCIADLSGRYDALDRYRQAGPDLGDVQVRAGVGTAAAEVATAIGLCDGQAGARIRSDPEFRRLADGMSDSLAKIPAALEARDPARLHRLLIELRAFERLLAFRYG
ncbi:hypothetical protein ASF53_10270 [Methylobacterium sp. Leaf123]|uniref:hypothetical protein n=1 Tax=Methylobacterium sp. Leaf123 TaxID=1736264 RepID=UPI0006F7D992|nr:hypothetical protein [Methylobacterium sp. Leaf123]KQQ14202.1 hypothetical protein ASF53_10270 [Methylobacterium sp. Leaf123]